MNSGFLRPALVILLALGGLPSQAQSLRLPGGGAATPSVSSAPSGSQRASDYIVAVVNSEPITNLQVRQEMQRLAQFLTQQQQPIPSNEALAEQALNRLIDDRTQIQFARESGVKVEEFSLDEAEQTVARQNQVDTAEMYRRLSADGVSRSQFRNNLRDQMLLSRVREREVGQRIRVSELDIDQYLIEQKTSNSNQALAEVNIAHILLALPESPTPAQLAATQAKAQQIVERVRAGEDFSKLARELSQAPDAAAGGVFGLRAADRYPSLFVEAVQKLGVGDLTTVRSGAGVHVLRLLEKRAAGGPATSVVQSRASHILLRPSASMNEAAAAERLSELRKRIVSGQTSFEAAAKEFSQDGSAAQGGDLGWTTPGQFVPEFESAMEKLQPGEISEPLISRFGAHLIQLRERKSTALGPRDQREAVRVLLREKKYDEAFLAWSGELRARAYVDMREPPS
jgi:peptidyl-prolyl cis-trans isomerase SurA